MSVEKEVKTTYHAAIPCTKKQWINFNPWIVPEIHCLFDKYSPDNEFEYVLENKRLYTPSFRKEAHAQELEDLIVEIFKGG